MKYSRSTALPVLIFVCLTAVTLVYWYGYQYPSVGIDDANIYMVYMKNLAKGNGFVWNTGGEKVEGFTSLLWTLTGSLLYLVLPAHITSLLLAAGFVLTFFTLYNITAFARELNQTQSKPVTATDLVILSLLLLPRGFVEWNVLGLMETSLWTFLLTTITLQLCRYSLLGRPVSLARLSLLVVLLNITRPESSAFNCIFIAVMLTLLYAARGWKYAIRQTAVPLAAHVLSLAALTAWRLWYFGYPLPNTYYAKVSANRTDNMLSGARYLLRLFYFYPHTAFICVVALFFAVAVLLKKRSNIYVSMNPHDKTLLVLLATAFAGLLLPLLTGGDHFLFNRFYQPLLPLLYLAVTDAYLWKLYAGITVQYRKWGMACLTGALVFACVFLPKLTLSDFFMNGESGMFFPEFIAASRGRAAAVQMNETFAACRQYPSIGTVAAGGTGYMYNGKTIDLMGLNNTIMAHASSIKTGFRNHASFDKKGFWALRPDILGTAHGGEVIRDTAGFVLYENMPEFRSSNFIYIAMKKIQDDEDFRAAYLPALVRHKDKDYSIFGYYARSFLSSLDTSVYRIKLLGRTYNQHTSTNK